jgi:Acyltransferase family
MKPNRLDDAATPRRKGTPMTPNGTSVVTERSTRIDWVDYAKGICIVMVVMMHSVLGVEAAAGQTGFMHLLVAFAKPFRMPDFFLISGLFLSVVIDRGWRTYLDHRDDLACSHHCGRRRSAGAVADSAGRSGQFPVRTPHSLLDRAEKAAGDAAAGGVVFAASSPRTNHRYLWLHSISAPAPRNRSAGRYGSLLALRLAGTTAVDC